MRVTGKVSRVQAKSTVPRHIQVRGRLLKRILDGTFPPGTQLPSELELAEQLGVSRMTANKGILHLADEGWLVRRKGSGTFVLDRPHSPLLIAVVSRLDDKLANGILSIETYGAISEAVAATHGFREVIQPALPCASANLKVSGILAVLPQPDQIPALDERFESGTPVVILGGPPLTDKIPHFGTSRKAAAMCALSHFSEMGHRRIVGLENSNTRLIHWCEKISECLDELQVPDLQVHPMLLPEGETISPAATEILHSHFKSPSRATAVLAGTPDLALAALRAIKEVGLSVPEDVSLVSFGEETFLAFTSPPISSCERPLRQLATLAVDELVQMVLDPEHVALGQLAEPTVTVRNSTGPAPTHR